PVSEADAAAAHAAAEQLGLDALGGRDRAPRPRDLNDLLGQTGIDAQSVARLRPFVTVLPQRTWINANTAGPEVLAAWVPGLTLERAQALLAVRDSGQWFINRGDFAHRLQLADVDESEIFIGITSEWFRVSSALTSPRTTVLLQALLHDDKTSLPAVVWLREGA
ncbi:MAG: type II secretion system protein GspK, partial [Rhodocyclaceae bacterium]